MAYVEDNEAQLPQLHMTHVKNDHQGRSLHVSCMYKLTSDSTHDESQTDPKGQRESHYNRQLLGVTSNDKAKDVASRNETNTEEVLLMAGFLRLMSVVVAAGCYHGTAYLWGRFCIPRSKIPVGVHALKVRSISSVSAFSVLICFCILRSALAS